MGSTERGVVCLYNALVDLIGVVLGLFTLVWFFVLLLVCGFFKVAFTEGGIPVRMAEDHGKE